MKVDQNLISLFNAAPVVKHSIKDVVNERVKLAKETGTFLTMSKSEYEALHVATKVSLDTPLQRYKGCIILVVSDDPA